MSEYLASSAEVQFSLLERYAAGQLDPQIQQFEVIYLRPSETAVESSVMPSFNNQSPSKP